MAAAKAAAARKRPKVRVIVQGVGEALDGARIVLSVNPATTEVGQLKADIARHAAEIRLDGAFTVPAAVQELRLRSISRGAPSVPLLDIELLADCGPDYVEGKCINVLLSRKCDTAAPAMTPQQMEEEYFMRSSTRHFLREQ